MIGCCNNGMRLSSEKKAMLCESVERSNWKEMKGNGGTGEEGGSIGRESGQMASFSRQQLPEDLIIGVLLSLPVKSLLRFRCLSKSWCAIITSRNFKYEHLSNNRAGACLWAQFLSRDHARAPTLNLRFPDETLADLSHHSFDAFDGQNNSCKFLHGPLNGIFFVGSLYALWNPATKEYRQLPHPHPGRLPWYVYQESYGFGWDPITKAYKVVILQEIEHEDININLVAMVHTLGTEHWNVFRLDWGGNPRPVHSAPHTLGADDHWNVLILDWAGELGLDQSACHTYLDGFYYFQFVCGVTLSFDMATDAIEVIPPPNELELIYANYAPAHESLALFQDTIALFHILYDENCLRVWILKEKSWIKHLTVGLQANVKLIIGCWNDEVLLLSDDADQFLLYKLTTQEIRNVGFQAPYCCKGFHAYKESLISIEEEYEYRRQRDIEA